MPAVGGEGKVEFGHVQIENSGAVRRTRKLKRVMRSAEANVATIAFSACLKGFGLVQMGKPAVGSVGKRRIDRLAGKMGLTEKASRSGGPGREPQDRKV